MKKALLMIVALLCMVVQGTAKEPFTLWNECDVRDHADLALGGDHGGPLEATPFPCRYLIDYVRVWQNNVPTK